MTHVATLISSPAAPAVDANVIAAARARLGAGETRILADGIAADLEFIAEAGAERVIAEDLRARLSAPIDVVVQPVAARRKRLLLADMDSTMIGQECIDELADELGLKPRIAAITERAMRGEIAFEPALRERVGLLAGLPANVVERVIATRIHITPGAIELVATMKAAGAYTALVSGGFTVFTGPISRAIGFHEHRSNTLVEEDGRLAGRVLEPIVGQDAKRAALHELSASKGVPLAWTLAVGDGANDLAMIRDSGLGVAFHAKPKVAAEAHARIDHGDLTALLYLQGYARDEFVGTP
ncbi:phosphoserine phosphatase SerB [Siculibacillus lacustris]|uniref:Phosphoserine phosphatase n=2 Tax=Siculibacillus lacustris TaxID=1549641 RepID=A0A4Q9VS81_9HYPH|nr:phosphoserine phosphatase SerB [Siculibacillus lacustris]